VGAEEMTFGVLFAAAACASLGFGRVPRPGPVRGQVLEMLLGLYWVAAVLATGGGRGRDWALALGAFGTAYALILGSQLAIRALRR
jgi:hypothetical protein